MYLLDALLPLLLVTRTAVLLPTKTTNACSAANDDRESAIFFYLMDEFFFFFFFCIHEMHRTACSLFEICGKKLSYKNVDFRFRLSSGFEDDTKCTIYGDQRWNATTSMRDTTNVEKNWQKEKKSCRTSYTADDAKSGRLYV